MLLRDFKFSIILAVTTLVFAGVAAVGIRRYQESQPPDPRTISLLQEHSVISGLSILRSGRYLLDLEFDNNLQLHQKLCAPPSAPGSGRCNIPANTLNLQWRLSEGERVIAEGGLLRQGATLQYGLLESIELGTFRLPRTPSLTFSLWTNHSLAWLNEGYPRLRIWRDPGERGDAHGQGTPATTNAFFAAFFFAFLLILVLPLEWTLRNKRNRSSISAP
jgi:hypothetical protein